MSDVNKELLDLIKHFTTIIHDLNGTFASLSTTIDGLSGKMEGIKTLENMIKNMGKEGKKILDDLTEKEKLQVTINNLEEVKGEFAKTLGSIAGKIDKFDGVMDFIMKNIEGASNAKVAEIQAQTKMFETTHATKQTLVKSVTDILIKTIALVGTLAALWFGFLKDKMTVEKQIGPAKTQMQSGGK